MKKAYDFSSIYGSYLESVNERSEFEAEWRDISDYLLPGRGIYQQYSKPRKRKLTSPKVINTIAEDALYVLTSGMHGGLTSPSRPWFRLSWTDQRLEQVEFLKGWMQQCDKALHRGLQASNFYSVINSFYIEYAGFGTGSIYVGEDTGTSLVPFRFELLTAGEYSFAVGADGRPAVYFRTIFMTPRQLVERFPETVSKETKKIVKNNEAGADKTYLTVLEYVVKERFQDKAYTRVFYELGSDTVQQRDRAQKPLEVAGYYEFPYPLARWGTIGSDIYGIGPGSRSLPDVKRLQEMEKSFLMATHKAINPPLNVPSRMRGKLNTLPGGENYYATPNEVVTEMYQVRFDYNGVSAAIERVEDRIRRNFFNDIFLTATRDPNASPLKAKQVENQEQERMLRLGPVIERLQHEFLQPVIERCFNIMLRKGLFPEMPREYEAMVGDYQISLISPLATAQRAVALQGINSFMAFLGQAAQFDQSILDNINVDKAAREYADITGVDIGVLREEEQVRKIRESRRQEMARQQQKAEQMAEAEVGATVEANRAKASRDQAEAGVALVEGQSMARNMGMM